MVPNHVLYQVEPHPDNIKMVRPKGFEPLTLWFVAKYSIQLSYERIKIYKKNFLNKNGGSEWNRTTDTGIFSPLLYRLSYRAKKINGGPDENRTRDLLRDRQT